MRVIIATSDATNHIIPIQDRMWGWHQWQMDRTYVNHSGEISGWCQSVLKQLEFIHDYMIIFGLDDFIPIERANYTLLVQAMKILHSGYDRVELNWGASKHKHKVLKKHEGAEYWEFTEQHDYTVSTQFSLWKTDSLKRVLHEVNNSPWKFETQGRCKAACLTDPALRYIEESMLSKRQPGKYNVLGMRPKDVDMLVKGGLLDRENIIYGWKGHKTFTKELAGKKYERFYI